jgi:hypothetical protein
MDEKLGVWKCFMAVKFDGVGGNDGRQTRFQSTDDMVGLRRP